MKILKLIYLLFIVVLLSLTCYISYNISLSDLEKKLLYLLEYKYVHKPVKFKLNFISIIKKSYQTNNYFKLSKEENSSLDIVYSEIEPIVYIYNTHSNEEYSYLKNNFYNITPSVREANYILQAELEKYGIKSIVETNNTINVVNNRGLKYSDSYKVSREFLENKKIEYPSLEYFIDIHRDSVDRNITTTEINGISYAKTMFLLGLENENYFENEQVMVSLNNYLDTNYKGLSRGIYRKKGKGVNGIYNQDFNKNVMLIEVGGVDNTIEEVSNSLRVIASCLSNYIENHKLTKTSES